MAAREEIREAVKELFDVVLQCYGDAVRAEQIGSSQYFGTLPHQTFDDLYRRTLESVTTLIMGEEEKPAPGKVVSLNVANCEGCSLALTAKTVRYDAVGIPLCGDCYAAIE